MNEWKRNPDGSYMVDEDGKLVGERYYEMQKEVAETVYARYLEFGEWWLAGIGYGEGPHWAEAICKRYGLIK